MALNLKNQETERLARELARITGESLTVAVTVALKERLDRQQMAPKQKSRFDLLKEFSEHSAPLFENDPRSANDVPPTI